MTATPPCSASIVPVGLFGCYLRAGRSTQIEMQQFGQVCIGEVSHCGVVQQVVREVQGLQAGQIGLADVEAPVAANSIVVYFCWKYPDAT